MEWIQLRVIYQLRWLLIIELNFWIHNNDQLLIFFIITKFSKGSCFDVIYYHPPKVNEKFIAVEKQAKLLWKQKCPINKNDAPRKSHLKHSQPGQLLMMTLSIQFKSRSPADKFRHRNHPRLMLKYFAVLAALFCHRRTVSFRYGTFFFVLCLFKISYIKSKVTRDHLRNHKSFQHVEQGEWCNIYT